MRKIGIAVATLLLASCYDPAGRCAVDDECLAGQVCTDGLCVPGTPDLPGDPPVAVPDPYALSLAVTGVLDVPAASGVLANDSDPGGGALTAELVTPASYGLVILAPDGGFVYDPIDGYLGPDAFTYRASNGVLRSAETTVSITVGP